VRCVLCPVKHFPAKDLTASFVNKYMIRLFIVPAGEVQVGYKAVIFDSEIFGCNGEHVVEELVEALCYKLEGRGCDSQ
jgi:hypothetical protein